MFLFLYGCTVYVAFESGLSYIREVGIGLKSIRKMEFIAQVELDF